MPNVSAVRDAHEPALPGLEVFSGPVALFFIDDQLLAEWSHACTYAVVERTGVAHFIDHEWPPLRANRAGAGLDTGPSDPRHPAAAVKKRALLLSGGLNRSLNHPRYARNVAAAYRRLVRVHRYDSEAVRVCFAEGKPQDLLGDGSLHSVTAATQEDVDAALEWLAELGADDQALCS